jgi:hypothetical protein
MRPSVRSATFLTLSASAVLAAAGCGGSGGGSDTTTKTTSSTKSTSTAAASGKPKPYLRLVLHAPGDKKFTPSVQAKAKDAVQLVADFGSKNPNGTAKLTIPAGPAPSLKIKGHVLKGPSKTATITAPKGQKIGVQVVQYRCQLPPAKTFCPIEATARKDGTADVTADTKLAVRLGIVLK